jgi:hypothetical protein
MENVFTGKTKTNHKVEKPDAPISHSEREEDAEEDDDSEPV